MPGTRVLLIGAGRPGPDSDLPPVPAVPATIADLADVLVTNCGLDRQNLRVVRDPDDLATLGRVIAETAMAATDVLLVYYVGHGVVAPDGRLYLATTRTNAGRQGELGFTSVPYEELRRNVVESPATTTIVILDACFSGRAVHVLGAAQPDVPLVLEMRGGYVLASSSADEYSLALPGERYTVFSGELIRLLADGDPRAPRELRLRDVHKSLLRSLASMRMPKPKSHGSGHAADFVLAMNPAVRPEDAHRQAFTEPEPEVRFSDVCPYPGLRSYDAASAQWFHGRTRLTMELAGRVLDRDGDGLPLAVIGPSGSGKSSLLRAGLLPGLSEGRFLSETRTWRTLVLTPTAEPISRLAAAIAAETGRSAGAVRRSLTERTGAVVDEVSSSGRPVLIVVDQFEELFTLGAEAAERQAFVDALCAAARSAGTFVVISVRADFYPHCAEYPQLVPVLERQPLVVGPMSTEELRDAIVKPAQQVGLQVQPGLVELLLRELAVDRPAPGRHASPGHDPGALPLLAHILEATWRERHHDMLTVAGYTRAGGINDAIAVTADRAYHSLGVNDRDVARRLLLRLTVLGEDSADTRRRLSLSRLAQQVATADTLARVVDALAQARLVTVTEDSVEITHEAVLRAWPRLRNWIDADRAWLIVQQQITTAARSWDEDGRSAAGLLRGSRLVAATEQIDQRPEAELTPIAREFMDASVAADLAEKKREQRQRRWRRRATVGLALLSAVVVGVSVVVYRQSREIDRQHLTATADGIAAQADALRNSRPQLAQQLAVAAYRTEPTPRSRAAIFNVSWDPEYRELPVSGSYLAFAASGELLATASKSAVNLWNPATATVLGTIPARMNGLDGSAIDRISMVRPGLLAVRYGDSVGAFTELWDVRNPASRRLVSTVDGHESRSDGSPAASLPGRPPAGAQLYFDGTAMWNVADPSSPAGPYRTTRDDGRIVPIPGGNLAVAVQSGTDSSDTGSLAIWDISDPGRARPVAQLAGQTSGLRSVAVSPDGSRVAAVSQVSGRPVTVRIWDVRDPRRPAEVTTFEATGSADQVLKPLAAFSPDARRVAVAAGTVNLWDITDSSRPQQLATLETHAEHLVFAPDGRTLATAGGAVRLWQLDPLRRAGQMAVVTTGLKVIDTVRFATDHRSVVVHGTGGARVWDTRDVHRPRAGARLPAAAARAVPAVSASGAPVVVGPNGTLRMPKLGLAGTVEGQTTLRGPAGGGAAPLALHVAADGKTVMGVYPGSPPRLAVWRPAAGADPVRVDPLPGTAGNPRAAHFGPDGSRVALVGADQVLLVDLGPDKAPEATGRVPTSAAASAAVAFSPDGGTMAVAGPDSTVRLWDVRNRDRVATAGAVTGLRGSINDIGIGPDGRMLALAAGDGTVQLWDLHDPAAPARLTTVGQQGSPATAASFSGDGFLAAGFRNGTLIIIDTDPDRVAERICGLVTTPVTPEQWTQYVTGLPYNPPC